MDKVLTYNPSNNSNTFLEFTERTIHTEHGKMYKVTTESGHSITVTDDHSLATVGTKDFFAPLPPAESLDKFVPVISSIEYDKELGQIKEEDIQKIAEAIIRDDAVKVEDYMLNLPIQLICPYILCGLDRQGWEYKYSNKHELQLFLILAARIGFLCNVKEDVISCEPDSESMVPQDGKLVKRTDARLTNVYKRLPYTWSKVVSVNEVPREDVTYDFTVPVYPLFIGNSILVYDTMQLHVPVTEEARLEAISNMMPSKNLFSARTLDPMMLPQQESVYGLYECSTPSKEKIIKTDNAAALKRDIQNDKIKPNHPVLFKGKKTTAGIAIVNESIPQELRNYTGVWNKKMVSNIMTKIGKTKPSSYARVADEIKELGALYAYKLGCSFKTSDFDMSKERKARDTMYSAVDNRLHKIDSGKGSKATKYHDKVTLLRQAQDFNQKLTDNATSNTFHKWAYSGARGSNTQVMQIITSPTIVSDPKDNVVPVPIKSSWLEGLSPADYWVSSYGTRKGTVSAKLSTPMGGTLAKEVVGNVLDVVISTRDCGTREGMTLAVSPANRKDIIGRYEAVTNKFIDDRFYENRVKSGKKSIVVRSPIKCHAQHGVCQMCYGNNEKGKLPEVGENVGVVAAQAVTEPLTQMGLSSKHTAGTAAAERVGLSTIKQFFTMPNTFAGAALISEVSGTVTKAVPGAAGGTDVYIGRKRYHVAPGVALKVKVGDTVHAGDIISSGIPNIKRIVPHKGIDSGRETFVESATDLYSRAGAPSVRKNFETIARGLVNYVKIKDPGDSGLIEGDIVDYNQIRAEISKSKTDPTKAKMKIPTFEPIQAGTTYSPQFKTDWLANFGFKYLKQNMIENAATGATSDLHSYHPISGYAAAAEFGKGKDGRY